MLFSTWKKVDPLIWLLGLTLAGAACWLLTVVVFNITV